MNAPVAVHFVPPVPPPPDNPLPLRLYLRAIRTNALTIFPRQAYTQDVVDRHFLGRHNLLLNAPDGIHRVLVDNAVNYRRSPASVRILRPVTGQGLLLSEGEAWRLQRRTVAPALAPRVMPMLARHIVTVTAERLDGLPAQVVQRPLDLLAAMQGLALEIAGRSMFSMEMQRYGAAMRRMLTEYAERHAPPHLLDMLLPPSVPTWRDLGRARFQKRWMALIEAMMADRLAAPHPDVPRDLFDLLRAAMADDHLGGIGDLDHALGAQLGQRPADRLDRQAQIIRDIAARHRQGEMRPRMLAGHALPALHHQE